MPRTAAALATKKRATPPSAAALSELAAEWVHPSALKLWANNPRKNDGEPVNKVIESIKTFGFGAPIVARRANKEIIAGHTRWKAATKMNLERVPVRFLDITERQAHLLALADNKLGEFADWDDEAVHAILATYDTGDQLLAGWDDKAMRELERVIRGNGELIDDAVPAPPKNPITKPGDLWVLGKHRLVCGDSTDAKVVSLAVVKLKPFIMVTDPPYGVNYDPEWRKEAGLNNSDRMGKVENDSKASWIAVYKLFTGDVAYVWCGSLQSPLVAKELDAVTLERRSLIIWDKPALVISRGHYHWKHETCWYAVRKGKSARWCGDRTSSTVWEIARKDGSDETVHSTQKPVECMGRPIRNHGIAGDVVYDPFCGSGTTLVAAEQLERTCVALELSPAYCDVIVERWQKLTGGKAHRNPTSTPVEGARRKSA
jgi:DNA modification methylase